jgi:mannose-binding lectin
MARQRKSFSLKEDDMPEAAASRVVPFTHDDLYALLQLAANDAQSVASSGVSAIISRMVQFVTAQLNEKLPQYDIFTNISLDPSDSLSYGNWENKFQWDGDNTVRTAFITWSGQKGVLPGIGKSYGLTCSLAYAKKPDGGSSGLADGIFTLPPNISFGLTVLANSASEQTISVFVDGQPKRTFRAKGVQDGDGSVPTQVYNSGSTGRVQVKVSVNGKDSKMAYKNVVVNGVVHFGIVVSEDGTDNDYNDCIAILNWPLG